MTHSDLAKDTYRALASLPSYGPFGWVDQTAERRVESLQPNIWRVLGEVVTRPDGSHWAPSPWHAAIFARTLVQHASWLLQDEAPEVKVPAGQVLALQSRRQRPIFRGHADSSWPDNLTPRSLRMSRREFRTSRRVLDSFTQAMLHLQSHVDLGCPADDWAEATAQHYGLPTQLLDFTTDPDIAVAFGAQGERRSESQEAVLFMLLSRDAMNLGMEVILPPPYVERLHIQNGLFVRVTSRRRVRRLRRRCMELRFPLDPEFAVIREESVLGARELLPATDWFSNAVERAFDDPHDPWFTDSFPSNRVTVHTALCSRLGCESFVAELTRSLGVQEWLWFIDEMLHWLVVRFARNQPGWGIDPDLLDHMVRANCCVVRALIRRNDDLAAESNAAGDTSEAKDRRSWNKLLVTAARACS